MVTKALRSASRVAFDMGESDRMGWPPESITRGKRLGIGFDPVGRPVHGAILPGAEPQQDGAESLAAQTGEDPVKTGEVEMPLLGFDAVPVDRVFHGVQVHGLEAGPGPLHHIGVGAEIAHLAAQHEEGLAIHHQTELAVLLYQLRDRPALRGCHRQNEWQGQEKSYESVKHDVDSLALRGTAPMVTGVTPYCKRKQAPAVGDLPFGHVSGSVKADIGRLFYGF